MNSVRTLTSLLLGPALLAQGEIKIARPPQVSPDIKTVATTLIKAPMPAPTLPATSSRPTVEVTETAPVSPGTAGTRSALERLLAATDVIGFDRGTGDGAAWACGIDYKVGVTGADWTFIGRPEAGAGRDYPLQFTLRDVAIGGKAVELRPGVLELQERRVAVARGGVTEIIDVRREGAEQSFRFDTLPERGAITVGIEVRGDLEGRDVGDGVLFDGPFGDVAYGEAVAIDAKGARVHAETTFADGRITITVPAEFVATAQLPLVIDPIVTSRSVYSSTWDYEAADIAWDETHQVWALCWQRNYSATDTDVFAVRLNADMSLNVGPITTIDGSTTAWERPRIANNNLADNFLVVAQVSADLVSPYWIGARTLAAGGGTGNQIDVERDGVAGHAAGDKIRPDVAGDPLLVAPTYYTIVWERVWSTNDHDLHCKQSLADGTLRTAAPTILDNTAAMHSNVSISKSAGGGDFEDQRYVVAFQQRFTATDEDIWGAMLTWDGDIVQRHGSNLFPVDTSVANNVHPVASSPSNGNGGRFVLFAYENTSVESGDIEITLTDVQGGLLANAMLGSLQNLSTMVRSWPQVRPTVDTDGCRFAVAYDQLHTGIGTDWNIRVSLVSWLAPTLRCDEEAEYVASTVVPESGVAMASRYSGSGSASTRYGIAFDADSVNSEVHAALYDGVGAGGITMRTAGCGGLVTQVTGRPALGESFTLSLQTQAFAGFLTGPSFPTTVVGLCPLCTIGVGPGPTLSGGQHTIAVPCIPSLVGGGITVQGFAFDGTSCLGQIRAGNAYDIVVQ
ncbi:MAG: hypothetical protein IPK26_00325 [Planctomycetes bacterium]|nr:hypothetical protein [Planctomycetota bacterium]